MARTKHLTGKRKLSAAQQHRAETFRNMLLQYHGLKGRDATVFENIVKGLSQHQLTNVSRQYQKSLEVWYDSLGVTTVIAQDLLNRVRQLGKATLSNAVREIQTGGTKINRDVLRLARQYNLKDVATQDTIETLGFKPGKWGNLK